MAVNMGRTLLDRLTAWSPVLLLGSLAALTYWLDAQVQQKVPRPDGSTRHDPDLFIERFRAASFDTAGKERQSLAAERAQHFPDDSSTDFTAPALTLNDPGRPRMSVTADKGVVSGDRQTVTFTGKVRAVRDAMPPAPKAPGTRNGGEPSGPVTVSTESLRVIPKAGRADTDAAVTIEEPRGIIHGVGMELDNQAKTLKIRSRLSGTMQPQQQAKAPTPTKPRK